MVDREYCSDEHRQEARLVSARALRDVEAEIEPWTVYIRNERKQARNGNRSGATATVFGVLAIGLLVVASIGLPGGGGGAMPMRTTNTTMTFNPQNPGSGFLGGFLSSRIHVTQREDFRSGLRDWVSTVSDGVSAGVRSAQIAPDGSMLPGSLQIWKRTTLLSNYEMEFMGEIEQKGMGWAFRASDAGNFYGTKLNIGAAKNGTTNSNVVRYVMIDGKEVDRVQLPLPVTIAANTSYKIRLSVRDNRFVTTVNGQVISSWADNRLHTGGVGFFTDPGELARVHWVTLAERDSFLGRMVSHFTLIQLPSFE